MKEDKKLEWVTYIFLFYCILDQNTPATGLISIQVLEISSKSSRQRKFITRHIYVSVYTILFSLYKYYVFAYMCYKYYGPQSMHGNQPVVEKVHFPSSICSFFALCFVTAACVIARILGSTWSWPCSLPAPFRKLHKNLLNLI